MRKEFSAEWRKSNSLRGKIKLCNKRKRKKTSIFCSQLNCVLYFQKVKTEKLEPTEDYSQHGAPKEDNKKVKEYKKCCLFVCLFVTPDTSPRPTIKEYNMT